MIEFTPFPKIGRWTSNLIAVTEKIDGTNGLIHIEEVTAETATELGVKLVAEDDPSILFCGIGPKVDRYYLLRAGSRSRWLWPGKTTDNFGFANWVQQNALELIKLGPGAHYGEWWGAGIQRRYGLVDGDKRFSLFNVGRWADTPNGVVDKTAEVKEFIAGVSVVPTLYYGKMRDASGRCQIEAAMDRLKFAGSQAAPGFDNPEGVMVYFENLKQYAKAPFDPNPKG